MLFPATKSSEGGSFVGKIEDVSNLYVRIKLPNISVEEGTMEANGS